MCNEWVAEKEFAEALDIFFSGEKKCKKRDPFCSQLCNCSRAFSAIAFLSASLGLKKGEGDVCGLFYGCFLRDRMMTKPTRTIAMIMAMTAGMKYSSTMLASVAVVGVGVAAVSSTAMAVIECEPQNDLDPANVATILYSPGTSGTNEAL